MMAKKLVYFILILIMAVSNIDCATKPSIPTANIKTPSKITLIELGSMRCIPCKIMRPILKEIEEDYKGKITVIFYDIWTNEEAYYGEKYKIRVIPTQIFLDQTGTEYFRHEGFFPKSELVKILNEKLK